MASASTAQSIPPEIIREIFKHFSTPLTLYMLSNPRVPIFPWYLGHICSLWRAVFMSMYDEFWCKYKLHLAPIPNPSRSRSIIAQTTQFLERTTGRPFSFQIDGQDIYDEPSAQIFRLLAAESSHWQEASFTISETKIPILSGVRNRVQCLRSLELALVPAITWRPAPPAAQVLPAGCEDLFESAPLLTRIMLSSLSTWRFNWHIVTSFHLTNHVDVVNNEHLFRRLPYMTNLEELAIDVTLPRTLIQSLEDALIVLPRLRLLRVAQLDILPHLSTPSLEQLCLRLQVFWTDWSFYEECRSFFGRVGGPLQYLSFRQGYPVLPDILPHVVQLKMLGLHLRFMSARSDYFRFLACSIGEQSVVPNLETLRIYCESLGEEATTAINDMVTSRTIERPSTVKPLRRIIFVVLEGQYNIDMACFDSLKQHCALCEVEFRTELTQIRPVFCEDFLV